MSRWIELWMEKERDNVLEQITDFFIIATYEISEL